MKAKKSKRILIPFILVLILAIVIAVFVFLRIRTANTLVGQQNYVASKLIELGDYEQGRSLAAESEQIKENSISRQLMVIAAGYQTDFASGIRYAQSYLTKKEDALLQELSDFYDECLKEQEATSELTDSMRKRLLQYLLQVQHSISVKKNSDGIQAMLEMMSTERTGLSSGTMLLLQEDSSAVSEKVQAVYAISTGDYQQAFEKAQKLFQKNNSFAHRALLANLTAQHGSYLQDDEKAATLMEEQDRLYQKQYELQQELEQASNEKKKQKLERQIQDIEKQIEDCRREMEQIPVQKAINFIETTTPITERSTVAYKIELSQLYYQAGKEDKATDLVSDVLKKADDSEETAGILLNDFIKAYLKLNGKEEKTLYDEENDHLTTLTYNRLADLLNFTATGDSYESTSYCDFLLALVDRIYNGLIIRSIDTSDFPTVRVTVNVAVELEEKLKARNFGLSDMGTKVSEFTLLDEADLPDSDMSVVLVVDRSGSMDGTPMDDTKKAVSNFVKSMDGSVRTGLVVFDDVAQLLCPVSENKTPLLKSMNEVYADGGTSIYSGLSMASDALSEEEGKKVVILLSDGEDGDAGRIEEVLTALKQNNIYVYSIGFGGADTEYLSYIASRCGGKFLQADSSKVLGEIYRSIGNYMDNDYVLEFTAGTQTEDFSRFLEITSDINDAIADEDYHVGVPYDEILKEDTQTSLADYYRQIGGSSDHTATGGE